MYYNHKLLQTFYKKDVSFFKGAVLKKINSIIYNVQENDWMMTAHSSGIIYGNNAFLFIGKSGSGKSTLAAYLYSNGLPCISDDFIVIDKKGMVYPFPAAISLKEDSFPLLESSVPDFSNLKLYTLAKNKVVKKIPLYTEKLQASYTISALILLHYNKQNINQINLAETENVIDGILRESWINPNKINIKHFFNFIKHVPIYNLYYNSSKKAFKLLSDLQKTKK